MHPDPALLVDLLGGLSQPAEAATLAGDVVATNASMAELVGIGGRGGAEPGLLARQTPELLEAIVERLRAEQSWSGSLIVDGEGVAASAVALRSDDGDVVGVLALVTGAAAALRENVRLSQEIEQLRRLESLGRLASGIVHDFNNMLAVIGSYADLALKKLPIDSPGTPSILQIREAAQRSAQLTRQLLSLTRRQAATGEIASINDVLRAVEPTLRAMCGAFVHVEVELAPEAWSVVLGRSQLEQILLNLAVNSRDAMPDGGAFSVRTTNLTLDDDEASAAGVASGRYVRLDVEDSGSGMSEDVAAHAFEAFYTTKSAEAGTGLGLAIIDGIVSQVGGHVSLRSEPGSGTRFSFYLPAADAPRAGITVPPTSTVRPSASRRVLLVDDEPLVLRSVSRMLVQSGYDVVEAPDGEAALVALARAGAVDIVLTDVVMPLMNGMELAEHLAASHPALPVLFMSAHAFDVIERQRVDPANLRLLHKPFGKNELLAQLDEMLRASARRA